MEFCCEYARSSIGSCKACHKAVSKNSVKLGCSPDFDHCGTTWFHFSCFFKKCYHRKELKDTSQRALNLVFGGYDSLKETDQERLKKAYEKFLATLVTSQDKNKASKRTKTNEDDDEEEWKPPEKKTKQRERDTNDFDIGQHMFQIDGFLFLNISKWKGIVLIAIREFYKPPRGKLLKPGKNGISLTNEQYCKMWNQRNLVNDAIEKEKENAKEPESPKKKRKTTKRGNKVKTEFEIENNRKICVKAETVDGEQQVVVDIREYTSPEDGLVPTEKGIALTEDQWRKVLYLHRDIVQDLAENFDTSCPF